MTKGWYNKEVNDMQDKTANDMEVLFSIDIAQPNVTNM